MSKRAADDGEASAPAMKKAKQDVNVAESPPNGQSNGQSNNGQLSKDDAGNYYLDLGGMKRVTVSTFKGKPQLNIREYYTDKNSGDIKPGKKGITLNPSQWAILISTISPLTEKLEAAHTEDTGESSKSKKPAAEKSTKSRRSEKLAKKKIPTEAEVSDGN